MAVPKVAPHVGAWIETVANHIVTGGFWVAPHVGAWIETCLKNLKRKKVMSRPTWARGLKLTISTIRALSAYVAPHVGAWIETYLLQKLKNTP